MKAFEYAEARTEAGVLELLSAEPGKTELLAGGTDLIGLMKKMIVTPDRVVNIMEIPSLKVIEPTAEGGLVIGAAVTLDDLLENDYVREYPALVQAIRGINSMQLQAQGTLGGEVCQRPRCWFFRNGHGLLAENGTLAAEGDSRYHAVFGNQGPAKFVSSSRTAPALIALGAHLRVLGPAAEDESFLPLSEFYRAPRQAGQREHVLEPRQWVTHIVLPPPGDQHNATYEVRDSEGPAFPLAAAAARLELAGGVVRQAQIVLGQVAPTPWVSQVAADVLRGLPVTPATAEAAGQAAISEATPLPGNQYKVQLAKVAVKRAVLLAAGLETGGF
ncbi:MAG: FAD binding domain-containing protein [Pirellulaceae bacterium]|nr:FAD binding domain-containing protein [Pirellulaceae bacterium]